MKRSTFHARNGTGMEGKQFRRTKWEWRLNLPSASMRSSHAGGWVGILPNCRPLTRRDSIRTIRNVMETSQYEIEWKLSEYEMERKIAKNEMGARFQSTKGIEWHARPTRGVGWDILPNYCASTRRDCSIRMIRSIMETSQYEMEWHMV